MENQGKMKRIKLVASDIDGTLIYDKSRGLAPEMVELVQQLTDMGILFVAASGRQYPNLYRLFGPVQDKIAYIAENGCLVRWKGETIYKNTIEDELALEIMHKIWEKDTAEVLVSGEDTSYVQPKRQEYYDLLANVVKNNVTVVDDIYQIQEPVLKVSLYDHTGVDEAQKYFRNAFGDKVTAVTSGFDWFDFTPAGANKGTALRELQKKLQISPEECMAFGDEYNDIEMLENVRYSYAMKGGKPKVKQIARTITDSVESVLAKLIQNNGKWEELS